MRNVSSRVAKDHPTDRVLIVVFDRLEPVEYEEEAFRFAKRRYRADRQPIVTTDEVQHLISGISSTGKDIERKIDWESYVLPAVDLEY
jgi:hypothetical protein